MKRERPRPLTHEQLAQLKEMGEEVDQRGVCPGCNSRPARFGTVGLYIRYSDQRRFIYYICSRCQKRISRMPEPARGKWIGDHIEPSLHAAVLLADKARERDGEGNC